MPAKSPQTLPDLSREYAHWETSRPAVVGVDEVGRGCLAGPVVVAAVLLPAYSECLPGVKDSKKLSLKQREGLYESIKAQATRFSIGAASVAEIDRINILNATYLAMQRALRRIQPYDHALIDGRDTQKHDLGAHTAVIGGDQSCYSIACASILAKVIRDRLMRRLAHTYPGYAWETNAGYGTKAHLEALQQRGITPFHRRSYAPIKVYL